MCFDATTSAAAFAIVAASSLYLYYSGTRARNKNDMFFSGLLMLVALVQLLEYFIWKNQQCDHANHILSVMLFAALSLQPIAFSNWYYYLYSVSKEFAYFCVLLYSIAFSGFSGFLMHWLDQTQLCTMPTETSCRLHWAAFTQLATHEWYFRLWSAMYAAPWLVCAGLLWTDHYKDIVKYPIRHLFVPLSCLLTVAYIVYQRDVVTEFLEKPSIFSQHADAWGSLWCFSGVLLAIVALLGYNLSI